jgi:ActR/RegA family two-component response regulator
MSDLERERRGRLFAVAVPWVAVAANLVNVEFDGSPLTDVQAPDDDDAGESTLSVSRLEWEHIQRVLTCRFCTGFCVGEVKTTK